MYYYHNDHLGTPQAMTDASGTVVWKADYLPFGEAIVDEDPDGDYLPVTNNLRFPGQYFDIETGLHYNWHRDYSPGVGRYFESDPIGLKGGFNVFVYAKNNPVRFMDPAGNEIIGGGTGAEGHALLGGGWDTFWCCDGKNFWQVVTVKVCFGAALGASSGATIQCTNAAAGVTPRGKCPDRYAGFAPEYGVGPVEYGAGLPENNDGIVHSAGVGLGGGFKVTLCHYFIIDKRIIGCCGPYLN